MGMGIACLLWGPGYSQLPVQAMTECFTLGPGLQWTLKRYLPPPPLTLLPLQFLTNKDDLVNTKSKSSP